MNAYRIPNHDAMLLAGSTDELGDVRAEAFDLIAFDYDRMQDIYADAGSQLTESGDLTDVLKSMDEAAERLEKLLVGETSIDDPTTCVLIRELVRQALLVKRKTTELVSEQASCDVGEA